MYDYYKCCDLSHICSIYVDSHTSWKKIYQDICNVCPISVEIIGEFIYLHIAYRNMPHVLSRKKVYLTISKINYSLIYLQFIEDLLYIALRVTGATKVNNCNHCPIATHHLVVLDISLDTPVFSM